MPVSSDMDRHVRRRQIELAHSIQPRKKIYLDTCFWIALRKVLLEQQPTPVERKLLHLLKRGVRSGRFICPISESTFVEVMKQTDLSTRAATATLIDELSLGVALTSGRTRTATEIAHFYRAARGARELYDMQELVWTKLGYAMGPIHPTVAEFDAETELQMQIEVFDELWGQTLVEISDTIGGQWPSKDPRMTDAAAAINADIKAHQANLVSYEQTYRDEIVGAADNYRDVLVDLIAVDAESAGEPRPAPGSPAEAEDARITRNLLAAAFAKPETKKTLRSMHIQSSLHAGLRWNKGTKFVANHFFDFEHATGALAYCDAFFTEAFLANLINAKHINLSQLNGCQTTNRAEEAVRIVQAL